MPNEAPSLTKATYDKKRIVEFEPGQPCPVATSAGATPRQKKSRPKATYQFQNARHADERQSPKKRRLLGQLSEINSALSRGSSDPIASNSTPPNGDRPCYSLATTP